MTLHFIPADGLEHRVARNCGHGHVHIVPQLGENRVPPCPICRLDSLWLRAPQVAYAADRLVAEVPG